MDKSQTPSAPPFSTAEAGRALRRLSGHPLLPALVLAMLLLGVWEGLVAVLNVPAFILPAPSAIWSAGMSQPVELWAGHVWATLEVVLLGLGMSCALGGAVALTMAVSRGADRAMMPLLVVIQSTPIVALAPILIVSLGAGVAARTAIVALITFFPIVIGLVSGIRSTPAEVIELSRSLDARRARRLWQIEMMFAVPQVFAALKVAVTLAVIGAVVAEFVAADAGLGYAIKIATSYFRMPQAFFALGLLVCLSLALFAATVLVQRRFFAWSLPKDS